MTTGERLVGPMEHTGGVKGIKFSPDGRRIATACYDSIHIVNSYNGDLLITIDNPLATHLVGMTPISWSSVGRLFAISESDGGTSKIKSFDASTGSQLAEWQVHSHHSGILMSIAANNRFIASSADRSASFWDTSTHTELGSIQLEDGDRIRCIALSPDVTHLATGGGSTNKTITIWNLSDILPESCLLITVSTTFLMLGRPITLVYQSMFL